MKQSLELKLGQHLTITPQLQQAIRLLQLSSLELQQEIREAIENNPLLEEVEESPADVKAESLEAAADAELNGAEPGAEESATDAAETAAERETDADQEFDQEPAGDSDWEAAEISLDSPARKDQDGPAPDLDARNSAPLSLRDHLAWQMQMTPFTDGDRRIALALIDAISDDGYLSCGLDEIQQAVGGEPPPEIDEIQAVLHQIQNFDPVGVGARDLGECLQLQLRNLDPATPFLADAKRLATPEHLDLLAKRDYGQLRRLLKLKPEDLQHAITLIQGLNPRPGAGIQGTQASYVVPDVLVRKQRGVWRAELNGQTAPRLRINHGYEHMIQRGKDNADNKYLQDRLQEARWFIKSLASRSETLLKVARAIVDRQRAFFDHGPEAMKPLVLNDIAEAVGMHESTISRVTTNKYMLTPRGIFELKYFFSSHVSTADGGTCSATAIRSLIKKLVEVEKPLKPISDSTIAEILSKQGIFVARRTVAKYRESLHIPPSSQRKSLV
ncbi:MAG: RNA polymerase factor sigma-54 [Gammaproteobacteria bacterium]|nr:RNA polymerase factor sigma-54 [Gammaproteobacteria bacterium]